LMWVASLMAACADYLSKKTLLSSPPDGPTYFFRFDAATLFHAHVVCTACGHHRQPDVDGGGRLADV
jgi:hypothetical protein